MGEEEDLRGQVVETVRALKRLGLNLGSSGNVSARLGDRILISPTGAGEGMGPEDVVLIDRDGETIGAGIPSSEWRFHAAILAARPEAQGVVHAHADHCVALACLRRPLPAFHYTVAAFGGDDVRCAGYAPFGSQALSDLALEALEGRSACLLANHGMIAFGRSLAEALARTQRLEQLVRQYLMALQIGEPTLLSSEEMNEVRRRFAGYGKSRLPA